MSNETITPGAEDRTVAIVSYLTLIGFIVAVVLHSSGKKTALGSFHLRQCLGILVTAVVAGVAAVALMFIPIIGWLASMAIYVGLLIIWITGLIAAANGQQKPAPLLGESYQKWFAGAFN
jgi:uncharacterized membrane protein